MSLLNDAEAASSVPTPTGTQQALYLDSTTGLWSTKTSSGTTASLSGVTSVSNSDGTITVTGSSNDVISRAAITGDVAIAAGSNTSILATVNSNTGSFGGATAVPAITVNAKGLTTAVTSTPIQITESQVTNLTSDLASKQATGNYITALTGDVSASGPGSATSTLATVNSNVGSFGSASSVAVPTVNAKGLITAISSTSIQSASASQAGFLSYTNYSNINNWFGSMVYNVADYGVAPGNTAAANVSALNTLLQTTAPAGAWIQFGPGTYSFNAGLTTLTKDFAFRGIRGQTTLAINTAMGSGTNFFTLDNTGYYTSFRDLNFVNFATQTSNYCIECANDVNVEIMDCFFTGASNWAGVIDLSGTNSGNGAILKSVYIANFTGTAINGNSPLDTQEWDAIEIIGTGGSSIGVNFFNGGATLCTNSQIIKCNQDVVLAPTTGNTVSACFFVNCYFDQGVSNALAITGAGTVLRCHFIGCWFTSASTGSSPSCVLINTTGSSIHSGIFFEACHVINATTGSTGTLNGFNISAISNFSITGGEVSGWTNGINIVGGSTTLPTITGVTIGPSGGVATNTNGIVISGTVAGYNIQDNNMNGNTTTPFSDTSTVVAGGQKIQGGNSGMLSGINAVATGSTTALTTVEGVVLSYPIPAGSLKVGSQFIITAFFHPAATSIITARSRIGSTGTTSDASVVILAADVATNAGFRVLTAMVEISAVGSSAGHIGGGSLIATAVATTGGVATSTGTFNSAVLNYLTLTLQNTTSTTTTLLAGEIRAL